MWCWHRLPCCTSPSGRRKPHLLAPCSALLRKSKAVPSSPTPAAPPAPGACGQAGTPAPVQAPAHWRAGNPGRAGRRWAPGSSAARHDRHEYLSACYAALYRAIRDCHAKKNPDFDFSKILPTAGDLTCCSPVTKQGMQATQGNTWQPHAMHYNYNRAPGPHTPVISRSRGCRRVRCDAKSLMGHGVCRRTRIRITTTSQPSSFRSQLQPP